MQEYVSCTGMVEFVIPGHGRFIWLGPGGGIYMVIGATSLTRLEHPTAAGQYETRASARRALKAFIAAVGRA